MATLTNVIFIGGASASGKSTTAQELASQTGRPYLELDRIFNSVVDIASDGGIPDKVCEDIAKGVSLEFARALIENETQSVCEGGWISPEAAAGLASDGEFQAVYCGYTDIEPHLRLQSIKSNPDNQHWLAEKPEDCALDFLNLQIEGSRWYRDECRKHGLPYFDFSDQTDGASKLPDMV
jgi:shikimate kinase